MLPKTCYRRPVRGGRVQATTSSVDARASPKVVDSQRVVREDEDAHMSIDESKMSMVPRYAISQEEYDASCVGNKALRLQELRKLLQPSGLDVENTVSLPFGAVKQLLEGHYENAAQCRYASKVQQSIDELMDDHGAGSEGAAAQSDKVNRQLFEARHALRGTTLPELAKTELVEAFLEARMPMPTDREGWQVLESQIAEAISQIYTPHGMRSGCSTLLKEPVSVLLRDRRQRDYDFTAFVDAAGGVYGEFRVPFCADRGIWFSWDGESGSAARTVCHPCPQCMTSSHSTLVELDGSAEAPASAALHHSAGPLVFPPARSTFEGDNLLVMPRYRQILFQRLAEGAQRVRRLWDANMPCTLVGGVAAPVRVSGFVTPDMCLVVSDVVQDDCGLLRGPLSADCAA
eukprot:jgi/Ulvmu1/2017/UM120_0013.1